MARSMEPIAKKCKALGLSPAELGYTKKTTIRNPKAGSRRKQSEYGIQLQEKQKVKFVYGVLERQFRKYYEMAANMRGVTGENMLCLLERRLDNVVFRLGLAKSRPMARQIVNHGHILVDGHKVDIASFLVKPGMVISVREKSRDSEMFKEVREFGSPRPAVSWLEFDAENLTGKVAAMPKREDIDVQIEEHLIVEFYSR